MPLPQFPSFLMMLVVSTGLVGLSSSQNMRVAPGVPPQHYDPNMQQYGQGHGHPPPPQQHQQQPPYQQPHQHQVPVQQQQFQQQQVPIQHQQQQFQQQVPIQQQPGHGHIPQVQQPPPHGHVPQTGGGHGHGHAPGHGQQILDTSNIGQERQHIQDHMSVPIDTSQMSEQELQFHYFKMHDADNNNKLDGCELVKSLIHWHVHEGAEEHAVPFEDDQIAQVVDQVLDYDVNQDGMIDYPEFSTAQNLAEKRQNKKKCETCRDNDGE